MDQMQKVASELMRRREARRNIYAYIPFVRPSGLLDLKFDPAQHHKLIIDDLHALIDGQLDKEAFSLPPGSAKSTYISVILPTFLLAHDPTLKILCISAGESLAEDFARRRRAIMRSKEWQTLAETRLAPDAQGLAAMSTEKGGTIYCAGAGSTIQGLRADYIIMDDLVKGFEQANNLTQLDKIWNWLLSECRSRLKPHGREILVATRWSAYDPIGRVLELTADGVEDWKYCRIPMECDSDDDPLNRERGEPLWADWFTPKMLADAKLNPAIWACLYQQTPLTSSNSWCPVENLHIVKEKPKILRYVIGVDIALTINSAKADYTVFAVLGVTLNKDLVLVDVYRNRQSVDNTAKDLITFCEQYSPTSVFIDNDNASKVWAKLVWEESKKQGVAVPLQIIPTGQKDKETRAAPLRSYLLQDRLEILQAPWNTDLLYEFSKFPDVRHDDQVDAVGLVAAELIKISAPSVPEEEKQTKNMVIGDSTGQLMLNETLDDLFANNESGRSTRFNKVRI